MALPKIPKPPTTEEKLAALNAASGMNATAIADKETGGKPWLLADKKAKIAYPARLDGDINAKLEFMLDKIGRGTSKNAEINKAIEAYVDNWLKANGLD